jgi:hypothetical protein
MRTWRNNTGVLLELGWQAAVETQCVDEPLLLIIGSGAGVTPGTGISAVGS